MFDVELVPGKINVFVMDATITLRTDVHDRNKSGQLMILEKAVTEEWKVKKCINRTVEDVILFSLKSDDLVVDLSPS